MIPGLPQVGGMELFILLVIILLFFGASRVPELARSLGKGKREFQKGVEEAKAEEERTNAEAEKPQPEEAPSEGEGDRAERVSQRQ